MVGQSTLDVTRPTLNVSIFIVRTSCVVRTSLVVTRPTYMMSYIGLQWKVAHEIIVIISCFFI